MLRCLVFLQKSAGFLQVTTRAWWPSSSWAALSVSTWCRATCRPSWSSSSRGCRSGWTSTRCRDAPPSASPPSSQSARSPQVKKAHFPIHAILHNIFWFRDFLHPEKIWEALQGCDWKKQCFCCLLQESRAVCPRSATSRPSMCGWAPAQVGKTHTNYPASPPKIPFKII